MTLSYNEFISPEMAMASVKITPKSDVWSVGAMIYKLIH